MRHNTTNEIIDSNCTARETELGARFSHRHSIYRPTRGFATVPVVNA